MSIWVKSNLHSDFRKLCCNKTLSFFNRKQQHNIMRCSEEVANYKEKQILLFSVITTKHGLTKYQCELQNQNQKFISEYRDKIIHSKIDVTNNSRTRKVIK